MESLSYDISVLKSAIVNKNLDKVQELLTLQPLSKNHKDSQDLLITAVEVGNVEITKLIFQHGCTIATSQIAISHLSLCLAVESDNFEMIKMLLASGASVSKKDFHCKKTPLQKACDLALRNKDFKIVDLMLAAYNLEDVNVQDNNEIIHFYIACMRNKTKIVEEFIKKGVSINIHLDHEDDHWHASTALHYAVKYQSLEVIELLLEKNADVLYQDSNMQSPLHLAFIQLMNEYHNEYARDEAEEIIDLILSNHDDDICNPTDIEYGVSHFHIACMINNLAIVENYLKYGVEVNAPVKCASNTSCTWFQNTPLHFAAISCKKDIIKLLMEHGADVNIINGHGSTPLWLLFENQPKYSKIKNFVEYCRSKNNKQQQNGEVKNEKSLISLIINEFEYIECILLLVEGGSNLNYRNEHGKPLLFELYDSSMNNFINKQDILGVYGSDDIPNICSEYLLFVIEETLDILKKYGLDLETRDSNGNTIFHCIACSVNSNQIELAINVAEIMMTFDVDPNVQNNNGEFPINIATTNGSLEFVELLLKFNVNPPPLDAVFSDSYEDDVSRSKMIDLLVKYGANVDYKNSDDETVLFQVARFDCYLSSMKSILEAMCNIDAQDKKGETALFVAVLQNNHQGTKLLLDCGADINIKDCNKSSLLEKLFLCNLYSDYVNQTHHPVLEILEMHIRKLRLTNCHVSQSNLINCKRLKFAYFYQPHLNTVKNLFEDEQDLDIDVSCKDRLLTAEMNKEIQKMISIRIDNETSLFDILFKYPDRIANHLENKCFQKCISEELLCSQFPYFGSWLVVKYKEGLERCECMDEVLKSLKYIIGRNFPNSLLHDITLYLNNRDMKNLLKLNL